MDKPCMIYGLHEEEAWKSLGKLIPGHNQGCERLIGDLKKFKNIDSLVSVSEARVKRPRINGNINKNRI